MLVNQRIANLLGGVSQRPKTQRRASEAEEQLNALSSVSRGVMKRPPAVFVGQLTDTVTGWDDAFVHMINRDEDERYHVVVANGDLKVFDAVNGVEVPVVFPDGKDYLVDTTGAGFRAVTVGDTTFIVNRGVITERGSLYAEDARNEALLYVRQADFSTNYNVTLDGTLVAIRTVDMDEPASRRGISTDAVAEDLLDELQGTSALSGFIFQRYGSTIHVRRSNGADFDLAVTDGLSDNGLKAIKGESQLFEDLPARAVKDFVVQITGSIDTAKDNYFVKYDDLGEPGKPGVWRECPKPGTPLDLNAETMPHRLALRGEVGVSARPHQGTSVNAGTVVGYVPEPVTGTWGAFLYPSGTSPNRTTFHEGGATLIAEQDADWFVAYHNIYNLRNLENGGIVYVRLYKNGVIVDTITHRNEVISEPQYAGGANPVFQGNPSCPVQLGDVMRLELFYEDGENRPEPFRVEMLIHDPKYYSNVGRQAYLGGQSPQGDTTHFYPIGTTVSLTVDGNSFSYDVELETDQDLSKVADELAELVDAHTDLEATYVSPNIIRVTRTNGVVPALSLGTAFEALTFYNAGLNLVPGAQAGNLLTNVTDGSSGIITANTEKTITVASLTGGSDNTIAVGDICAIFVDPDEGTHFVFSQIPWKERAAGDIDVVTFPSFIGSTIADAFFYQNRVGFLCKENIVFTSSGDLFNLFRYTATDFRADDAIDIRSAHADVTIFDSAFLWAGGLYVKSDNVWFNVSGAPALTPTTIRLDPVGRYPSSKDPRPVVVGDQAYFTRAKSSTTQVFELSLTEDGTLSKAVDITKDLPTYIQGSPVAMVGDAAEGFLAVLTDDGTQNRLYIFSFFIQGNQKVVASWSTWEFAAGTRIIGLDMADGVLGIVRKHSDGAYFEQIDLDLEPDDKEKVAYLDRRVESVFTPSGWEVEGVAPSFSGTATTWTLPYSVAVDGSEGDVVVVNRTTGTIYTTTRPTATTVRVASTSDLTGALVYIGQPYTFRWEPTTIYLRDQSSMPETAGRLQLRYLDVFYKATTDLTLTVTPLGRTPVVYGLNTANPADGRMHVPILTENEQARLVFTNSTPGPCAIAEMDWEGFVTQRARRM